jgi:hypothetical protein
MLDYVKIGSVSQPLFRKPINGGSSPNSLIAKRWECSKFIVLPGSRKEKQIAGNHKALVPPTLWRGFSFVPPKFFFSGPRYALRNARMGGCKGIFRRCLRRNLPSLPRPYRVFMKYSINEFEDEPKISNLRKFKVESLSCLNTG